MLAGATVTAGGIGRLGQCHLCKGSSLFHTQGGAPHKSHTVGEMVAMMQVLVRPPSESASSRVSLESRYGMCPCRTKQHGWIPPSHTRNTVTTGPDESSDPAAEEADAACWQLDT